MESTRGAPAAPGRNSSARRGPFESFPSLRAFRSRALAASGRRRPDVKQRRRASMEGKGRLGSRPAPWHGAGRAGPVVSSWKGVPGASIRAPSGARSGFFGVLHVQDPHGERQPRRDRGSGRRLLGRPDRARPPQFPGLGAALPASFPRRARPDQGRGRGGQRRDGDRRAQARRGDPSRRHRGLRGQARRPLPARHLPDRLRHLDQHERQRGDLEPRDRDARRRDGIEEAGPSQRPRQRGTVLERHDPDRDPRRRLLGDRRGARPGVGAPRRGARRQVRRVRRRGQDRPHPPPGRGAGPARPGVRRLRPAGGQRPRAADGGAAPARRARARRHRGRHRAQRAAGIRRRGDREDGEAHRAPVRGGARPLRGAGGQGRGGRGLGRSRTRSRSR